MIRKMDVTLEIDGQEKVHKNLNASQIHDVFNTIDWQAQYQLCLTNEDYFGPYFLVTYFDEANLEYNYSVEFYFVEDDEGQFPKEMIFSLSYSYQERVIEKFFFGLFGEKEKIQNAIFFKDEQSLQDALDCLNAFSRMDTSYLEKHINDK